MPLREQLTGGQGDHVQTQALAAVGVTGFAADVRAGLAKPGQKELPSKYLYDAVGSALFEVISVLPEYGLTRADERLLRRHAGEIAARVRSPVLVAELGSGRGKKTRWVLEALCRRQPTSYYPVDVSAAALAVCQRELGGISSLNITGIEQEFLDGLRQVASRREEDQHLLVLFLGGTLGNFSRSEAAVFLMELRTILTAGDTLLLGIDLVKPVSRLLTAYDDALGVTAAFNLNLLARINRELDADFDLHYFKHLVRFDESSARIEMHLRSTRRQVANIPKAGLSVGFAPRETIWTESSHKYHPSEVFTMAEQAGFQCTAQWIDREWPFAENLLLAR
jgi:L-histidine N-alpha-methyltransferase